jgi:hypothetical protein
MNRLVLVCLALPLGACAQTATIRELGHPAFEPVVGAETRFELLDGAQKGELLAYPDTVRMEEDHRWIFGAIPTGTADHVLLEIRAAARPPSGLPLAKLAAAIYPLTLAQAAEFSRTGALPAPESPVAFEWTSEHETLPNDQRVMILNLRVPRAALPPDADRLAATILAQLEDGWVHVRFYQTGVPVPQTDPTEQAPATEPPADQAPAAEPPAGEPPAGEPPAGEPPVDEPAPAEEAPPADGSDEAPR